MISGNRSQSRVKWVAAPWPALAALTWARPLWAEDTDEALRPAFHQASSADQEQSGGAVQKAQPSAPARRTGMILRLGGELSSVWPHTWVSGELVDETVSSGFSYLGRGPSAAWGGRFLLGWGIFWPTGVALVPHVFGSVHAVDPMLSALKIAGTEHRWTMAYTYWALGGGCEVELSRRLLLLGLGIGFAGLVPVASDVQTAGLNLQYPEQVSGPMGHVEVGLRLPEVFSLNAGVNVAFEGFVINIFEPPAYRVGGGVFVEFNTLGLK